MPTRIVLLAVAALLAVPLVPVTAAASGSVTTSLGATSAASVVTAPSDLPGQLLAVRVGHHGSYDRVVFEFSGPRVPARTIGYVAELRVDPSDQVVTVEGSAFLRVVFQGVASGQVGAPPAPQGRQTPRFPQLREIVGVGDFEGYVSFGIGLASKTAYRVSTLSNPSRLVLDLPRGQLPDTGSSPYPLGGFGASLVLLGVVLTRISRRVGTQAIRAPESTR